LAAYTLCEEKDEPNVWYMGDMQNGKYDFWGGCGNFQEALNGS